MGFETLLPFADIQQWLATTEAITRIMDLVQAEAKRLATRSSRSQGGRR